MPKIGKSYLATYEQKSLYFIKLVEWVCLELF